MKKGRKYIAVVLAVFIFITFVSYNQVQAGDLPQANSVDNNERVLKGVGIGGLVVLSVWGLTNWIKKNRAKRYEQHLQQGKSYLEAEEYKLAIDNLEEARQIKQNVQVTQFLQEAKANYQQQHYELGVKYLKEENWELAYQEFNRVRKYGSYRDSEEKYNQAYKKAREANLKRIAVVNFTDSSYRYDLGGKATSLFTAQLLEKEPMFIEVVDWTQLNKILRRYEAEGLVDSFTAQNLGQLLEVDYLVVGEVISGEVTTDRDSEMIDIGSGEDVEEKKRYTINKRAYTQVYFRLLSAKDGSVVLSRRVKKEENYSESYYQGESIMVTSDEELLDKVISKSVEEFAKEIYNRFEL
jgi:tetratricopeptide (TPR) repeat protein